VGEKRKHLACLLTLAVTHDANGEPKDELEQTVSELAA